jgi:hypothetical protein
MFWLKAMVRHRKLLVRHQAAPDVERPVDWLYIPWLE